MCVVCGVLTQCADTHADTHVALNRRDNKLLLGCAVRCRPAHDKRRPQPRKRVAVCLNTTSPTRPASGCWSQPRRQEQCASPCLSLLPPRCLPPSLLSTAATRTSRSPTSTSTAPLLSTPPTSCATAPRSRYSRSPSNVSMSSAAHSVREGVVLGLAVVCARCLCMHCVCLALGHKLLKTSPHLTPPLHPPTHAFPRDTLMCSC